MPGQATITIRDKQWQVGVANTPWEMAQGLGGLPELAPGTGMLFDLGWEQTVQVTTVPMLFPLDIAFFSEGFVVTEVYRNMEPGYVITSTSPARYFVEVNAGELEGIDSGDRALVELLPLEEMPVIVPDWVSAMISLMGFVVMGIIAVSIAQDLVKGMLGEPEKSPALLPQTKPEAGFRPGEIACYKGERVRVLEHVGDRVSIWVPSRQEEVWVKLEKLERTSQPAKTERESLASEILKGLSARGDGYRAYVRHPGDKSAFVTIGAIIGGHYSWNPAGFTVWVDAWQRNPEWQPDSVLAIKELRRPRSFEATEEGVIQALDYMEREFPGFTETRWVSKSIPLYVAYELGMLSKEDAPEWLSGVVVMPGVAEEAKEVMEYRIEKNEPYDTWSVVELWPGGTMRSPFRSKEEAIKREEEIGRYYGWKLRRVESGINEKKPKVIPTEPRQRKRTDLEYLADSPEFLTQTIDAIGYRQRLDSAFLDAIARAKGVR